MSDYLDPQIPSDPQGELNTNIGFGGQNEPPKFEFFHFEKPKVEDVRTGSLAAPAPHRPIRRRRLVATGLAGALLIAGGGVGIGHIVWPGIPAPAPVRSAIGLTPSPNGGISNGGISNGGSSSSGGYGSYYPGFGGGINIGNSGTGNSASSAVGAPSNAASIAKSVDAGLVDINTTIAYQTEQAAGTGIVLSANGEILTNNHVIKGAGTITATDIGNGKTYKARVVGYDVNGDMAVLQLQNASGLTTVKLASSKNVRVGDAVVGIGNAGGAGGTPSYAGGKITGLRESINANDDSSPTNVEHLTGLLATNAAIEAGDSGGPLVNANGEVIGMDTAGSSSSGGFGFTPSSGSETQGFAIPINTALQVVHLLESGKGSSTVHFGETAFAGVEISSQVPSAFSGIGGYGGSSTGQNTTGAPIVGAVSGSPAANAGLVQGDTIVSINGESVASPAALQTILQSKKPGQNVQVTYANSLGTQHSVTLRLASGPPQ